jgi:hypothetical protein
MVKLGAITKLLVNKITLKTAGLAGLVCGANIRPDRDFSKGLLLRSRKSKK